MADTAKLVVSHPPLASYPILLDFFVVILCPRTFVSMYKDVQPFFRLLAMGL